MFAFCRVKSIGAPMACFQRGAFGEHENKGLEGAFRIFWGEHKALGCNLKYKQGGTLGEQR